MLIKVHIAFPSFLVYNPPRIRDRRQENSLHSARSHEGRGDNKKPRPIGARIKVRGSFMEV
jgi:hypothetical protein